MRRLACAALVFGLGGCIFFGGGDDSGDDDDDDCVFGCPQECTTPPCDDVVAIVPYEVNRDLDILFVIDNSGSMSEEQTSLQNSFGASFLDVLSLLEGGLPNVHIGVVSSDVGAGPFNISGCSGQGDNGILQNAPRNAGCEPPAGQFISDVDSGDGTRITNYNGTLNEVFGCIARLGIDGCGFEQQLESALRALDGRNAQNQGFFRTEAVLALILVTDEDDCSTENTQMFDTGQNSIDDPLGPLSSHRCFEFGVVCDPDEPRQTGAKTDCAPREDSAYMYSVQRYVDFFKSLKADPSDIVVAGIIGNPDPVVVGSDMNGNPALEASCASPSGEAAPGIRLAAFLDAFPGRNVKATVCSADYSGALSQIADLLRIALGAPCLQGPLTMPLDCTVEDVRFLDQDNEERTELPACNDPGAPTNTPCYVIESDSACSSTETGLAIRTLPPDRTIPSGTRLVVTCKVDEVP